MTEQVDETLVKSSRNIPGVSSTIATILSPYMTSSTHRVLVVDKAALAENRGGVRIMRTAYDVIIRPIITEQSMEGLDIKKYTFEVAKDAGKIEIKKAVEEIFGVKVHQGHHRDDPCQGEARRRQSLRHDRHRQEGRCETDR